jgi:hypothetical protein
MRYSPPESGIGGTKYNQTEQKIRANNKRREGGREKASGCNFREMARYSNGYLPEVAGSDRVLCSVTRDENERTTFFAH